MYVLIEFSLPLPYSFPTFLFFLTSLLLCPSLPRQPFPCISLLHFLSFPPAVPFLSLPNFLHSLSLPLLPHAIPSTFFAIHSPTHLPSFSLHFLSLPLLLPFHLFLPFFHAISSPVHLPPFFFHYPFQFSSFIIHFFHLPCYLLSRPLTTFLPSLHIPSTISLPAHPPFPPLSLFLSLPIHFSCLYPFHL